METINKIKEALRVRSISEEELRKASKMSVGCFKDVMEGKRIAPDYLFIKLGELVSIKWKTFKAFQDKEIYEKSIKIGDRGLILN